MEDNEEKNLAVGRAMEAKEEKIEIKFKDKSFNLNVDEVKKEKVSDKDEKQLDKEEYSLEISLPKEDETIENIKIATIDSDGIFHKNELNEILANKEFTKTEKENLEKILAGLNIDELDNGKVKNMKEIKEKAKELEEKQKKENKDNNENKDSDEKDNEEKDHEEKDKDEEKDKEEKDEEERNLNQEDKQQEEIAKKLGVPPKNVFVIKKDSELYKNYPQLQENTYLYRDNDGKVKSEYIDENGDRQPSPFFNESTTSLREEVVGIDKDGNDIKKQIPYQVMDTNGLKETNRNARDIRLAIDFEQGYMDVKETRLGADGNWTGYPVEAKGRDYNSHEVNEISNTRTNSTKPEDISSKYEKVENTGLERDGVQMPDLSPQAKIQEFIDEGYNKDEAVDIYNYMIGAEKLSEEHAKERVNQEIEEKIEEQEVQTDENKKDNDSGALNYIIGAKILEGKSKEENKGNRKNEEKETDEDDQKTPWDRASSRRGY